MTEPAVQEVLDHYLKATGMESIDAAKMGAAMFLAGFKTGVATSQKVLAGEDTVEWARNATGSSLSLPYAIELLDDLLEDDGDGD